MNARTSTLTLLMGLLCLGLCLGLAACASHPQAHSVPPTRRPAATMIAPSGNGMLVKRIRQNLAERGWTLIHYDAAMLQGHQDYRAMARQARYRLILSGTPVGACRSGQPSFLYNLAIIENHTGTVALALSGVNCLDPIIQRFAADLDQKQVVPSIFKQSSSSPPSPAG